MLNCNGIKKVYNDKYVVDGLNFKVNKGDVFALLGSNGAGKTITGYKMMLPIFVILINFISCVLAIVLSVNTI